MGAYASLVFNMTRALLYWLIVAVTGSTAIPTYHGAPFFHANTALHMFAFIISS